MSHIQSHNKINPEKMPVIRWNHITTYNFISFIMLICNACKQPAKPLFTVGEVMLHAQKKATRV